MKRDAAAGVEKVFGPSYLVGGAPRDLLLRRPVKDLDFAVPPCRDFRRRASALARLLGAAVFPLDEERSIYRLSPRGAVGAQIDLAPMEGGSILSDLARRDFTVNAMAVPAWKIKTRWAGGAFAVTGFKPDTLIDPFGGLKALRARRLSLASPSAIKDDPLRMLRGFRFAAELGFTPDGGLLKETASRAALIKSAAAERVHEEISRIFATPVSADTLRSMHKAGLLLEIFPELGAQVKCAEVYYGKGGVLKHTFNVVERVDYLLSHLGSAISGGREIAAAAPSARALKTAALLHDIAKPARAKVVGDRLRFFGHEEHGAAMAEKVMERLRFSRADIRLVSAVTAQHLRVGNLAHNDEISDRAIYRFFREMGEYSLPLLLLSWADHSSYVRPADLLRALPDTKKPPFRIPPKGLPRTGLKKTLRFLQTVNMLFRTYLSKGIAKRTARLLNGTEVMKAAGIPEGPEIGRLLDQVNLLHFEGRLKTKKDALDWLKKRRK